MKRLLVVAVAACSAQPPPVAAPTSRHAPLAVAGKHEEMHVDEIAMLLPEAAKPLEARAVGILYAGGKQAWGAALQARDIGHGDDNNTYEFSTNGAGPYPLYFHASGGGQNFMQAWEVCTPGGPTKLDATSYAPGDKNRYGLVRRAYLVELDVNGGKGACGGQFVATGVKILDHTAELPLDPEGVLVDLRARFDAEVTKHKQELREILGGPLGVKGETLEKRIDVFPTWLTYEQQLDVLFVFHASREGWKEGWGMTEHRDPFLFAHPAPPPPRRIARDAAMAVRYTVDRQGTLLEELVYLPAAYSAQGNHDDGGE